MTRNDAAEAFAASAAETANKLLEGDAEPLVRAVASATLALLAIEERISDIEHDTTSAASTLGDIMDVIAGGFQLLSSRSG